MKKGLALIIIIGILVLAVGCASGLIPGQPPISATQTPAQAVASRTNMVSDNAYEASHQDQTWLSPGKVQIGNYHPGARAEWNLRAHNGSSVFTEKLQVTTDPGETVVPIKLARALAGDPKGVTLTSDNLKDKLAIDGYTSQILTISGFAPAETRIMSIKYEANVAYLIRYKEPSTTMKDYALPPAGAKDWVIITDGSIIMDPRETRELPIVVDMPEDAVAPSKWEFWISMVEANPAGNVTTELVSRWLVAMRG